MIRTFLISTLLTLAGTPAFAQLPAAPQENSGQDPTRPVTRVDVRFKFQDDQGDFEHQILTLRADKPFELGGGWKVNTRIDVPLIRTDTITPLENSNGGFEAGVGDLLTQALFIAPPNGRWAFAFGGQIIMPTGSDDQFTTGRWRLVPSAAAIYQLPTLSRGSFVGLLIRDDFSFAGDSDRAKINVVSVEPIFNWQLPNRWFLTFSPEAKFNTRDDWKLFLPFDVTLGRKLNARTVMSLQADIPIVDEYKQYEWQAEFRLGVFF